jgi:lysozyme
MTFNVQGVSGPDVSMYQDAPSTPQQIDFVKMRAAGAQFVIIRAGQNAWIDPDWVYNHTEAHKAGLPTGAYFFYDSRVSPQSQANLFLALTSDIDLELGIWLDLEEKYLGPYRGWANWKLCLEILKAHAPRVGIYTGPSYWKENRPLGTTYLNYFKSFPLWIANYEVSQPIIPAPWTPDECVFWQYGTPSIGPEYGVESIEIDMNHFNGDAVAFASYFGLGSVVLPPVVIGEPMRYEAKSIYRMSLRPFHNTANVSTETILPGQAIRGDALWVAPEDTLLNKAGDQWLIVRDVDGVAKTGFVAVVHLGMLYCTLTDNGPVVEPPAGPTLTHTVEVYSDGSIKVDGISFE